VMYGAMAWRAMHAGLESQKLKEDPFGITGIQLRLRLLYEDP